MKQKQPIQNINSKFILSFYLLVFFCFVNKSYATKKNETNLSVAYNPLLTDEVNNKCRDSYGIFDDAYCCFLNDTLTPGKKSLDLRSHIVQPNKRFILAQYNGYETTTHSQLHPSLFFNIPIIIYLIPAINNSNDSDPEVVSDVYLTYYINKSPNNKLLLLSDDLALHYDLGVGDETYVLSFTPFKLGISYNF
ncbi:hypothetical protein MRY82_05190 [bacterium]|nr:hypothetical protein [bacterium]